MKYFLPFLLLCVAASGPPMPPKSYTPAVGVTQGDGAKALIEPIPSFVLPLYPRVTLAWTYPESETGVTFNVYHAYTPSLSAMTILTNVAEKTFTTLAYKPQEFFQVKATKNGLESDWSTK